MPLIWHNAPMNFICAIFAVMLTNCTDVMSYIFSQRTGDSFDLTGRVILSGIESDPYINLVDASGGARIMGIRHVAMPPPFKSGDIIRTTGIIDIPPDGRIHLPFAICRSVQRIAEGVPPQPISLSAKDILSGRNAYRQVRICGRIRRIIRDEIDINYVHMPLVMDDETVYISILSDTATEKSLRRLIDSEIDATGIVTPSAYMLRRFRGCTVEIQSLNNISVIKQAEDDPYKAPMLYTSPLSDMRAINRHGRRRINGTVIATCSDRRILIQTDQGDTHGIHFLSAPLPSCGDRIEAVGIPEADYYQINLLDAIWRHAEGVALPKASPVDVTLKHLLTDGKGHAQINQNFHGKTVRLCGTIIDMPSLESGRDFAILKDSGETVLIDISSARDILATVTSGCRVRVTGICTANRDSSVNPQMKFLQLNGITIVIRSPDDIEILEHPPWWTPGRLAVVVTMLLILLIAMLIWNRVLRAVIDRKSRSLIREELSQVKLALRIDERTHLAIELHDSLSQNLSGIACQIAATKGLVPEESSEIARYLSITERMLGSCRNELRRCIWDLRENALDEKDFSEAIRKTLDPVSIGSEVTVEVDVPRSHIDDSTAHSILCIIRELVTNAIHHGKASSVNVTGAINGHTLRFSVVDNGSGFDTTAAPNANEGHFGLEGIRERIKRMNGAFDLKSSPGNGCSAVITISTSRSNER